MHGTRSDEQPPNLTYDEWTSSIRSAFALDAKGIEPKASVGWLRSVDLFGFAASCAGCNITTIAGCDIPTIERTQRGSRRDDLGYYGVIFQLIGRAAVVQNEEHVVLRTGDLILVDSTRPMGIFCGHGIVEQFCLRLPRQQLVFHLGFEPRGGLSPSATPAGRLLFQLALEAVKNTGPMYLPGQAQMQFAVYDLLGAIFAPPDPQLVSSHTRQLFARIRDIIKNRFTDPDLSPAGVAAEAGISLRYMQKLFTVQGTTCNHLIHALRLDHAARLIRRRALVDRDQPLSQIAQASGFRDYAYFGRKFHERFGHPPSGHPGGNAGR
jgi:AraC family transcriptional regulator, positive regulator of tynA and feaB